MVTLYSTHCPKCKIIEKKLKEKEISYNEINDVDAMLKMGLTTVPWLNVDGELMDFTKSNKWLNEQ